MCKFVVRTRQSSFAVLYETPDDNIEKVFADILARVVPEQHTYKGLTTYVTNDNKTIISIGRHYAQVRTFLPELSNATKELARFARHIIDQLAFPKESVTTRLSLVGSYDDGRITPDSLSERYLSVLPSRSIDKYTIEAAGMTYYLSREHARSVLTIGPYSNQLEPQKVLYVELETTYRGSMTSDEFLGHWSADIALCDVVIADFLPSLFPPGL
jgi:hypothetical protein